MIPRYIFSVLVALASLIGIISAAPVFENPKFDGTKYQMEIARSGNLWTFYVYSAGYKDKKEPVDFVQVNTATKTLIVRNVNNGYDKTKDRLRMREALKECWIQTGLDPLDLKYVEGKNIQNFNMESAVRSCRKSMKLGGREDFQVSPTDTLKGNKACWQALEKTIF